jgi:hypothetical protein
VETVSLGERAAEGGWAFAVITANSEKEKQDWKSYGTGIIGSINIWPASLHVDIIFFSPSNLAKGYLL